MTFTYESVHVCTEPEYQDLKARASKSDYYKKEVELLANESSVNYRYCIELQSTCNRLQSELDELKNKAAQPVLKSPLQSLTVDYNTIAMWAYDAYAIDAGYVNFEGKTLPTWGELPANIRNHWLAVVVDVVGSIVDNQTV